MKNFFGLDFLLSNNLFFSSRSPLALQQGSDTQVGLIYYKIQVIEVAVFEDKSEVRTYQCWTAQACATAFPFALPLLCL